MERVHYSSYIHIGVRCILILFAATVQLRNGAEAEEINMHLQGKPLLNERIGVSIRPNYNMLCVAHLPFSMTDATLANFAAQMGIVERCFLMRSEKTGERKL